MLKLKPRKRVPLNSQSPQENVEVPNLLDLQVKSYEQFVKEGLKAEFAQVSPIEGAGGKYQLEFLDGYFLSEPELSFEECKTREVSYCASLRVPVRLVNCETGEVHEQEVFMGDIPLMTEMGTFLVNGAERVIVSQFVRSPGVYFREKISQVRRTPSFIATIIPNKGSWLEFEVDHNNIVFAHINKMKKIPVTFLLNALGYTEEHIRKELGHDDILSLNFDKHPIESQSESLLHVYKVLHAGESATVEGAQMLLNDMFFNDAKYNLSKVGRYKINRRVNIDVSIKQTTLAKEDIIAIVKSLISLSQGDGYFDDIDHLANRRIRAVGEQLQRQFRVGLARLERLVREQMMLKSNEQIVPQHLINIRPLVAVMREFFGSSQLSQFMDQTNPLAEIVHKRRLSALGPGGLTKERAGFEVRDIHPTHYGRLCPIETPEGPNAGLIGPLATFGVVNEFGFIETPYHKVVNGKITDEVEYMTADIEEQKYIVPWDTPTKNGKLAKDLVVARYNRDFSFVKAKDVQYIGVSSKQLIGVACFITKNRSQ